MLVVEQNAVLVIDDLARNAAEIGEGQLVGIDGHGCRKGTFAEVHILVAAAAKAHGEEVYLLTAASGCRHPAPTEVNLSILSVWTLRLTLVGTERLFRTLRQIVLHTHALDKIEDSTTADIRQVGKMLTEMVMNLGGGKK